MIIKITHKPGYCCNGFQSIKNQVFIRFFGKMKKSELPLKNICGFEKQKCGKEALVKLLRWHFGYSQYRGKQLEAIESVLSGRDCFCLMPTGGGKSMCYQIPALVKPGIVLVVCPLIGLNLIANGFIVD
ncbi:hypothetical protein AgCh_027289 [Apium graveolens]